MRRVLCVWLPTFSTDLVKRMLTSAASGSRTRLPQAIILTRQTGAREFVARCCRIARKAGIVEGMDVAHARSLLPTGAALYTATHRADRDKRALHKLACWSMQFSPLVSPDHPNGLLIDLKGTERLHRNESKLIHVIASGIRRLGLFARVASASTFGCAWAVSRFGTHDLSRVPANRVKEAIAELPVAALRIDEECVFGLSEIGITKVSHLLNLPRASLPARFGPSLLQRLLQALGEVEECIEPVRPIAAIQSAFHFEGPTDHWESVEVAAKATLEKLSDNLSQHQRGVRRLDLELLHPRTSPTVVRIDLSHPSRAPKHLWSLLRSRLERIDLTESVEGLTLTASRTARLRHEQIGSVKLGAGEAAGTAGTWWELIDTLAGRFGTESVSRFEHVESHLPEYAVREYSAMEKPSRGVSARVTAADRPTILFQKPEPARVMALTPEGPVLTLSWRGRRMTVVSCSRPERLAQEWWRWKTVDFRNSPNEKMTDHAGWRAGTSPVDRDYFAAQTDDGRRLWLFRHAETTSWFVHGEWA